MDCLNGYIGLLNCTDESPESGLYINSLPGISLEVMDKIAEDEQITYVGLWNDIQKEASIRFFTDFIMEITKCFKIQPYCDYESIICDNKRILASAWRYLLGNQMMLFRIYSPRLNRFTTIEINQAKELRDHYQVEYETSLSQGVKLVNLPADCCWDCGGNPEYVHWLP